MQAATDTEASAFCTSSSHRRETSIHSASARTRSAHRLSSSCTPRVSRIRTLCFTRSSPNERTHPKVRERRRPRLARGPRRVGALMRYQHPCRSLRWVCACHSGTEAIERGKPHQHGRCWCMRLSHAPTPWYNLAREAEPWALWSSTGGGKAPLPARFAFPNSARAMLDIHHVIRYIKPPSLSHPYKCCRAEGSCA